MDLLVAVLTAVALAWVGVNLVLWARQAVERRRRVLDLVRGLRWRHVAPAPLVLAGVGGTFALLYQWPPLRWGWWSALGGEGNVVFGATEQTEGTVLELLVPAVFVALLVPAMPLVVEAEERRFRLGAEEWSPARRAGMAVAFGLVHLVVGIPVAAALALAVAGAWLQAVYLRAHRRSGGSRQAALDEATRAHLGYNLFVVGLVALALGLTACAPGGSDPDRTRRLAVTSPDISERAPMPSRFSCLDDNVPPQLRWGDPPPGTEGFAVVVEDPDASRGTFTHWVVTGIPVTARQIGGEQPLPEGAVESKASSGRSAYVGPCPPRGEEHRIRFRVHALRVALTLPPTDDALKARRAIETVTLAVGEIETRFRPPDD